MTDDEISEFAEALEWACQTSEVPVGDDRGHRSVDDCACPVGALLDEDNGWPAPYYAVSRLGLSEDTLYDVMDFMCGYDGSDRIATDPRLYDLGRQFRERYP